MKALNLTRLTTIGAVVIAMLATTVLVVGSQVFGNVTAEQPTQTDNFVDYNFFFSSSTAPASGLQATTTSATSTNISSWIDSNGRVDNGSMNITGAKKVNFYFKRGDTSGNGNAGATNYRVQVSPDGTDWYYWSNWKINASSTPLTATTNTTGTFTVTGTTTVTASMVLDNDSFKSVRCIAIETTDGEHSCRATAEF